MEPLLYSRSQTIGTGAILKIRCSERLLARPRLYGEGETEVWSAQLILLLLCQAFRLTCLLSRTL
jgi:hypothetical protein